MKGVINPRKWKGVLMALVPLNNDDLKEYAVLHNDIVD